MACLAWWIVRPTPVVAGVATSRSEASPPLPPSPIAASMPIAPDAVVPHASDSYDAAKPQFPSQGLAARVDRWARSSDPRDALRAYEAVRQCLQARAEDRTPDEELEKYDATLMAVVGEEQMRRIRASRHHAEQWCGDLRSDQIESRQEWLARAAAAGLQGATGYFIEEGPDGLGLLRGGPSVNGSDAWYVQRDAYIALALQHCDRRLPDILAATARAPEIPLLNALSYWSDKLQCDSATVSQPSVLDDPQAVAWLRHMGRGEPVP